MRWRVHRLRLDIRRAWCRRWYCPYWGCKPAGEYGWSVSYIGKFDKQAAVKGTCENCGGVIQK